MDRAFFRGKNGLVLSSVDDFLEAFSKKKLLRREMESAAVPGMIIHWGAATLKSGFKVLQENGRRSA